MIRKPQTVPARQAATVVAALLLAAPAIAGPPSPINADDELKIASLIEEFQGIEQQRLEVLPARDVQPYQLPTPGVDVMRARLEETYSVDGVGRDTVELTGWIAVRHGNARTLPEAEELSWNTAVVDTQFVGMELSGRSDLFGEVRVTLDRSRPLPLGQVGQIEIPELARANLVAELRKDESAPPQDKPSRPMVPKKDVTPSAARVEGEMAPRAMRRALAGSVTVPAEGEAARLLTPLTVDRVRELTPELSRALRAGACRAEVQVNVNMSDLGLEMHTETPVLWYSLVDTIPPVGHTASIAIEPVRLLSKGRSVGTLESGLVKFREVVRFVALSDEPLNDGVWGVDRERLATNEP